MQMQFTRPQLFTFLALLLASDTILIALIVGTSVSPAWGFAAGAIALAFPVFLFAVFVPVVAGAMGWFRLRRAYGATMPQVFRGDAPIISPAFGRSWVGLNNVVEAYADDEFLHMRLMTPVRRAQMRIAIPWSRVVEIEPHGKHRVRLELDEGMRVFIPAALAKNEIALRASIDESAVPA